MNFEEWAAKPLLAEGGVAVPPSQIAHSADEAMAAAEAIGPCVVKAQVPTGKRGKAGGIRLAATPDEARDAAEAILGMDIGGFTVEKLLVEGQVPIKRELYAAILNDPKTNGPMLLFSTMGGMDVEEAAEEDPNAMRHLPVDITSGLNAADAARVLEGAGLGDMEDAVARTLAQLYAVYRARDAELLEINPLVLTEDGRVVALDCKFTLCDSSMGRQSDIADNGAPDRLTDLEAEAAEAGLKYIELGGSVGVLANGAGLTMTTMDAITHYGGEPSNFLEVGGEAYTKAKTALKILLKNPNIKDQHSAEAFLFGTLQLHHHSLLGHASQRVKHRLEVGFRYNVELRHRIVALDNVLLRIEDRTPEVGLIGNNHRSVAERPGAAEQPLETGSDVFHRTVEAVAGEAEMLVEQRLHVARRQRGGGGRLESRALLDDELPGHILMVAPAVLVADHQEFTFLVEVHLRQIHRAGDGHQVHVGAQDLHPVHDVGGAQIERDIGPRRQRDLLGLEGPHLGHHLNFVLVLSSLNHLAFVEGLDVGHAARDANPVGPIGVSQPDEEDQQENHRADQDSLLQCVHG